MNGVKLFEHTQFILNIKHFEIYEFYTNYKILIKKIRNENKEQKFSYKIFLIIKKISLKEIKKFSKISFIRNFLKKCFFL